MNRDWAMFLAHSDFSTDYGCGWGTPNGRGAGEGHPVRHQNNLHLYKPRDGSLISGHKPYHAQFLMPYVGTYMLYNQQVEMICDLVTSGGYSCWYRRRF